MKYRCFISLIISIAAITPARAQQLQKKIILKDIDSSILHAEEIRFDENGNYLVRVEKNKNEEYFISGKDTTGPLKRKSYGQIETLTPTANKTHKYYLINQPYIFGPVTGKDLIDFKYPVSYDKRFIAVPEWKEGRINYYVNGSKIIDTDTMMTGSRLLNGGAPSPLEIKAREISFDYERWIRFSDNGRYIYYVFDKGRYKLFAGNQYIDSADFAFSNLQINDKNGFIYSRYSKRNTRDSSAFRHVVYTPGGTYRLGSEPSGSFLKNNNGYFIDGRRDSILIVNNHLFENIKEYQNLQVVDHKNFLFSYIKDSTPHLVVNGVDYTLNYDEIYSPAMDHKGNFSVYGKRNYYLYKFVNGKEIPKPITRYGVRAAPIYITPEGVSTHFFVTDDSFYVYRGHQRVLGGYDNRRDTIHLFPVHNYFSPTYKQMENAREQEPLRYLQINDKGYLIYKGRLSGPMLAFKEMSFCNNKEPGEIVLGDLTADGFFVIQKTGEGSYFLNINNRVYKKLEQFSYIYPSYAFFNNHLLIFYALENKNIVQLKINY
ncbi:hypothetical protein [Niabella sp.]|uniref:hypothetical protein n=1 Tax=Niabella sp. TaxID=1962976 RepID=UPI00261EF0E3|nr:hypothetical protein [Niabella sp.]